MVQEMPLLKPTSELHNLLEVTNILKVDQAIQVLRSNNMEGIVLSIRPITISIMAKHKMMRSRRLSRSCCHVSFEKSRDSVAL